MYQYMYAYIQEEETDIAACTGLVMHRTHVRTGRPKISQFYLIIW